MKETTMSTKTTIQQAANKVGVAEAAANLIADHLDKEGYTLQKGPTTQVEKGKLVTQPAATTAKKS